MSADGALGQFFPEVGAGGFTRIDGTVEFYGRVNALVASDSVVVDFGAGRGRFMEDAVAYRRSLRLLKGRVGQVIGIDVDSAVLENEAVDQAFVVDSGSHLPVDDDSVDLIVSDFTFEHVEDPCSLAAEFERILKSGGWICARTPNRHGYIGILARIVPNRLHDFVLRFVQPSKKSVDTFPTLYRLNTIEALRDAFPVSTYRHFVYAHDAEPAYAGNSAIGWRLSLVAHSLLPRRVKTMLFVFIQKM